MKTYTSYYGTSGASPAYSDGDIARIINNTQSDNLTWGMEMVNDSLRYLTTRYFWNEKSVTLLTVANQQFYNLPAQLKKVINVTVTIGTVLWQPRECSSRQFWDALNVIQFQQEFPYYYFIYGNQIGIWPTPSNAGDTITINYKARIVDLSMADVTSTSTGNTVTVTNGTTTVIATTAGTATTFSNWMELDNTYLRVPYSSGGDEQWYPIETVSSGTTAYLSMPYSGSTVSGASFTIGQTPLLIEDYQDLPLYRMGYLYYTTRFPDVNRATLYKGLYDEGFARLDDEFSNKSTNVVLSDQDQPLVNPNLYAPKIT